jgi:K+-transporting ATPase ATPase A chain
MTLENYLSLAAYLGALFLLTPFLGNYMANALVGKRVLISSLLLPIERLIYRTCFIDPTIEMSWKKYASSVLWLSFFGLVTLFLLQTTQQL